VCRPLHKLLAVSYYALRKHKYITIVATRLCPSLKGATGQSVRASRLEARGPIIRQLTNDTALLLALVQ
jgi:hypothetical protein